MSRRHAVLIAGVLFVFSCSRDEVPTASRAPGLPASVISDAGHSSGNAHFFFLPPMVGQPSFSGMFDPTLSPVVEVCEWTTQCSQIVARFTMTTGTGSAIIRTDTTGQQYVVNWNTQQCITGSCVLSTAKIYRLRVLVATVQLGFADVQLVANGSQIKNVNTSDYIGLVDGRTLPVKFRIEAGAIYVVPSSGGAVQVNPSQGGIVATAGGEAVLTIPPNALPSTVTAITVMPRSATGLPANPPIVPGTLFDFGPNGTEFSTPVTMKLAYDSTRIPSGIAEGNLRLYTYDATSSAWRRIPGSQVDLQAHSVTGPVAHFSIDAVVPEPAPDGVAWIVMPDVCISPGCTVTRRVYQLGDPTLYGPNLDIGGGLYDSNFMALVYSQADECYYQYDRVLSYSIANPAIATLDSVIHPHPDGSDFNGFYGFGLPCAGPQFAQVWIPFITPHSIGTTYLSVTFDGYVYSLPIIATAPQVASQSLSINGQSINNWSFTPTPSVGQAVTYSITPTASWGAPLPDKTITFTIDDPAIATLTPTTSQSVTVTGVASGCTWMTATVDSLQGRIAINVAPVPVEFAGAAWDNPLTMSRLGCGVGVVPAPGRTAQPLRWSPDGARIAWRAGGSPWQATRLLVANADGSGLLSLPTSTTPTSFSWSPDGTRIAFAGYDAASGDAEIHIINVDGSSDHVITTAVAGVVADCPEWSPDGAEIVFQRGRFTPNYSGSSFDQVFTLWATRSVYVINVDGTNERPVVANDGTRSASFPRWAPDGSRIAYLEGTNEGMVSLTTVRPDGTGLFHVSQPFYLGDESNYNRHYAWSPDGQKFELDEAAAGNFVIGADGTGFIPLPKGQYSLQPWSADSRQLVLTNGDPGGVARVNADASGFVQILPNRWIGEGMTPSWRPTVPSVP